MFEEEYEKLTRSDKALFGAAVNNLLYECYITRRLYDKKTRMFKANPDYLFLERNLSLVEDYLKFMDIVVSKSDEDGVIFVSSATEKNHLRTDTVTTLITYALRSYYEEALSKSPEERDVLMTSGALNSLVMELNLSSVSKRLSAYQISQSLRMLDSYNIINRANGTYGDPSYSFFILPTIRYIISNEKLNALYNDLSGESKEEENDLFSMKELESQEEKDEVKLYPGDVLVKEGE